MVHHPATNFASSHGRTASTALPTRGPLRALPSLLTWRTRTCHRHSCLQAGMQDDVATLNRGQSRQEVLAGEIQTGVADVADVDRSAELFLWLFQSIFGGGKDKDKHAPDPAEQAVAQATAVPETPEVVTLGMGCFWGAEAVLRRVQGVISTRCGFAAGHTPAPTYEQVCSGTTGHAEVVQVVYDAATVSFEELLQVFFAAHDACEQVKHQYRSLIICSSQEQAEKAQAVMSEVQACYGPGAVLSTEVMMVPQTATADGNLVASQVLHFYEASEHHQGYYERNGNVNSYCTTVTTKLTQLQADVRVAKLLMQDM